MTILQTLQADSLYARKYKLPEATLLVTLYGEASAVGKTNGNRDSTDEEVIATMKKFKAGAQAIIGAALVLDDSTTKSRITTAEFEISILDRYLPTMITTEELRSYIEGMIANAVSPTIGSIMGELKRLYAGRYDGAVASTIIKELLMK
jgi:hypothetical protein